MDPIQKANVKSGLYLLDVISYIAGSMGKLSSDSDCANNPKAKCDEVWNGSDPTDNLPSYLNPHLSKLPQIFPGLPAVPTAAEIERVVLPDPKNNGDLAAALAQIDGSGNLSSPEKARVKASLFLIDVVSYIASSMVGLGGEKECDDNPDCDRVWNGADPMVNAPARIAPSASDLATLFAKAAVIPAETLHRRLEENYLTDMATDADLQAALCIVDNNERPGCVMPAEPEPAVTTHLEMVPTILEKNGKPQNVYIKVWNSGGKIPSRLEITDSFNAPIIDPVAIKTEHLAGTTNLWVIGKVVPGTAGALTITIPNSDKIPLGNYDIDLYGAGADEYLGTVMIEIVAGAGIKAPADEKKLPDWLRDARGGSEFRLLIGGANIPESDRFAEGNLEKPNFAAFARFAPDLAWQSGAITLRPDLHGGYEAGADVDGGKGQSTQRADLGLAATLGTEALVNYWGLLPSLSLRYDYLYLSEQFSNPSRPYSSEHIFDARLAVPMNIADYKHLTTTPLFAYQKKWSNYNGDVAGTSYQAERQAYEYGFKLLWDDKKYLAANLGLTLTNGSYDVPNRLGSDVEGEKYSLFGSHLFGGFRIPYGGFDFTYNHLEEGTNTIDHGYGTFTANLNRFNFKNNEVAGQLALTLGGSNGFLMPMFDILDRQRDLLADYHYSPRYDDSKIPFYANLTWRPLWGWLQNLEATAIFGVQTGKGTAVQGGFFANYEFADLIFGKGGK